jgi:ABC-type nickel/cobalt efflux system permease component RcnA
VSARRGAFVVAVAAALALGAASPAAAHPLGDFSVSRFSGLAIGPDRITVHYVVDMAEVPAFSELERVDADADGAASSGELRAHAARLASDLVAGVSLEADGRPIELSLRHAEARTRPGRGGLRTLRIEATFAGSLPSERTSLVYRDANYRARVGWREIVAYGVGGQGIASSTVPSRTSSAGLRSYPADGLSSPAEITVAHVETDPEAAPVEASSPAGAPAPGGDLAAGFGALVRREISPGYVAAAMLLAAGFGALHALGPGHGKAIMAAYLVSAEGRVRHAVSVGVAVSAMHTLAVVALGAATLWASSLFPPEAIYPWLSLVSGTAVTALGVGLLRARLRARRTGRDPHGHGGHHHHGHGHSHALPAGVDPLGARGLVAVAASGGLLPSPSALVVLLGAVAVHRVALGIALVSAFSVGLAAALSAIGVIVIKARGVAAARLGGRAGALAPIVSAGAMAAAGLLVVVRAALVL